MGYINHHAIVVTSWDSNFITKAREKAIEIFNSYYENEITSDASNIVSEITQGVVNGQVSFLVAPDGSKEGWGASDQGDIAREALCDWLDQSWREGSYCDYVLVEFGGDDKWIENIRRSNYQVAEEEYLEDDPSYKRSDLETLDVNLRRIAALDIRPRRKIVELEAMIKSIKENAKSEV